MKTTKKSLTKIAIIILWNLMVNTGFSQNDAMMQAFYWNTPVDKINHNGYWWDVLKAKIPELKNSGITALWLPSPCKGNWGIEDMGYGIYDHYDLGNYFQKGTTETRFGSRQELSNLITACHIVPKMEIYADAVLNHNYGAWGQNEENNPALKAYVFGEAYGGTNTPYQNNDIKWIIPNAAPGTYYIQIKGYNLNWSALPDRGYNLTINWTHAKEIDSSKWEFEPNNGNGSSNIYPGSGIILRGHSNYPGDIDEYQITLTQTDTIVMQLLAMKETASPSWKWEPNNDQTKAYYPVAIWYNNANISSTALQALTVTKSNYPNHTGQGEPNYQWNYSDFHPSDATDWLGDGGYQDEIIPNTRWFGNDFNTYSPTVQSRLNAWGQWMVNTIGFDGFRLDFVRGFQVDFIANWIKNLPKDGTQQRYIVGEYWTNWEYRLKEWVNANASKGAIVNVFDFPLKNTLTSMCNNTDSQFDMQNLNHCGMVRNNKGNQLPGTLITTFIDNHDTGKERDKWIHQDWKMAYAYILTHEGRPCIFYPHFYNMQQTDNSDTLYSTRAPASLKKEIQKLIFVRKTYLGGIITVLTEVGNPEPAAEVSNVYVARRDGNGNKSGAIIVLNNNNSLKKNIAVDSSPSSLTSWAGKWLKNALNSRDRIQVQANGRVNIQAPARGYAIYVLESEYIKCPF